MGRTVLDDPLAHDLNKELNRIHDTDNDKIYEERKRIIEDSQEEEDLAEKLNNLRGN
jgi:hypothetical protein